MMTVRSCTFLRSGFIGALLLLPVALRGQPAQEDKMRDTILGFYKQFLNNPPQDCGHAGTTVEMKICAALTFRQADSVMQATYRQAYQRLQQRGVKKLQDDLVRQQKLWLDHRNGHCDIVSAANEQGSLYHIVLMNCLAELTRQRTKELGMVE